MANDQFVLRATQQSLERGVDSNAYVDDGQKRGTAKKTLFEDDHENVWGAVQTYLFRRRVSLSSNTWEPLRVRQETVTVLYTP